jgi:putative component of membrane protein insertase Oxa1/YidC/SpoIIIJ protein YidD
MTRLDYLPEMNDSPPRFFAKHGVDSDQVKMHILYQCHPVAEGGTDYRFATERAPKMEPY